MKSSHPQGVFRQARGVADRSRRRVACLLAAMVGLAWLPACVSAPRDLKPPVIVPEVFSATGDAPMPDRWWTALGDARLNRLVERALADNLSLRAAWDRLDQARATAIKSGAALWPALEAGGGASRGVAKSGGGRRTYANDFSLGLAAGYEVDLWGRVRSTLDAARLDALATEGDLCAAAMTLSAETVGAWARLVEQRGQSRLLADQVKTNRDYLEVITLKFQRGQATATDVLQQRQLVESTQGDRILVESAIEALESRLAVLTGRAPGDFSPATPEDLPRLPALPKTGIPAEWLRRRPDLRAAELRVRAADRRVAAAIADRFPKLSISARAETSADKTRDLFDNWLASLGANLAGPVFDAGQRRAEVDRARAALSEKLNAYGQTVLAALKEVEDALAQEARQREYLASLQKQLRMSRQSTDQTRRNYIKGAADFTRYLTTLLSHQRLQRTALQSRRDLMLYRINLYRSLGGGWPPSRPTAKAKANTLP